MTWGNDGGTIVQPVIMRYEGVALTSHAPHPATAMLFLDYVLGMEGSAIVEREHQLPAAPKEHDPLAGLNVVMMDNKEFATNGAAWSAD